MGAPLGRFLWGPADRWPIKPIPHKYRRLQDSDVETLILSGNLDFTTPAQNAREDLLPHLSNGRQIVVAEMGHIGDLWEQQPRATRRLLRDFLDAGVVVDSLYEHEPMDFDVRWGYPTLVKLIVGGVLLAGVLLGVMVWLVVRLVRRRRGGHGRRSV
jgi:hypothetical protein